MRSDVSTGRSFLDQISQPFVTCTKMKVASTHSFHLRHLLLALHLIFTLDLHLRAFTSRVAISLSKRHLDPQHTLNSQSQHHARYRKHHGRHRHRQLLARAARPEPTSKSKRTLPIGRKCKNPVVRSHDCRSGHQRTPPPHHIRSPSRASYVPSRSLKKLASCCVEDRSRF